MKQFFSHSFALFITLHTLTICLSSFSFAQGVSPSSLLFESGSTHYSNEGNVTLHCTDFCASGRPDTLDESIPFINLYHISITCYYNFASQSSPEWNYSGIDTANDYSGGVFSFLAHSNSPTSSTHITDLNLYAYGNRPYTDPPTDLQGSFSVEVTYATSCCSSDGFYTPYWNYGTTGSGSATCTFVPHFIPLLALQ